jgi:hypothetical protein
MMDRGLSDDFTVKTAVAMAIRAPSVHNSQPWSWRIGNSTLHLYAEQDRQLIETDPDGRDLMLSCGAALHHLRVSLAALAAVADSASSPSAGCSGRSTTSGASPARLRPRRPGPARSPDTRALRPLRRVLPWPRLSVSGTEVRAE